MTGGARGLVVSLIHLDQLRPGAELRWCLHFSACTFGTGGHIVHRPSFLHLLVGA